jgi:hypothetical protein
MYAPTGFTDASCRPARFAVLPLTGFCVVRGKKQDAPLLQSLERAKRRLEECCFPTYDLDVSAP